MAVAEMVTKSAERDHRAPQREFRKFPRSEIATREHLSTLTLSRLFDQTPLELWQVADIDGNDLTRGVEKRGATVPAIVGPHLRHNDLAA
jgi:hypothetical protein